MSMYIVNNGCINDVANLVIKFYPNMDLNEVFNNLLKLNIDIWNVKYDENINIDDFDYKVLDYSKFVYENKFNETKFKEGFYKVQIHQLVQSLSTYHYQVSESVIDELDFIDISTYYLISNIYENGIIKEIRNFITYNDLICYDNNIERKEIVCCVLDKT